MNHSEFAAAESAALEPTDWERWADEAEKLFGRSLDGNQHEDGYSMDGAYAAWEAGQTPAEYVRGIEAVELVASLQMKGGWGAWIKVTVANTPEADAAAEAFFRRVTGYTVGADYNVAFVDEEATHPAAVLGPKLAEFFFPTCEHGMSATLCMGPDHYPSREQEMQMGW